MENNKEVEGSQSSPMNAGYVGVNDTWSMEGLLPYQNPALEKHLMLREAFALRAPQEPQDWFHPKVRPKPEEPQYPPEPKQADYDNDYNLVKFIPDDEYGPIFEKWNTDVRAYYKTKAQWHRDIANWDMEYNKQHAAQWPWAWADAVIAAQNPLKGGRINIPPLPQKAG